MGFYEWLKEGIRNKREVISKSTVLPLTYTYGGLILGTALVLFVLGSCVSSLWKLGLVAVITTLLSMLILYGMYRFDVVIGGDKK